MKRILIIGCGGAGKTTLAIELGHRLNLEVIHLDFHFWHAGWQASYAEEWKARVKQLIERDNWVMDGNYSGTLDLRSTRADTIIFLDLGRWRCLWGILRRRIRYHGKTRPDLPNGCPEQIDSEFFWYVWNYRRDRKPGIMAKLVRYRKAGKTVLLFNNHRQIRTWLGSIR